MHAAHPSIDSFPIKQVDQGFVVQAEVSLFLSRTDDPQPGTARIDQVEREIHHAGPKVKQAFFTQVLRVLDRENLLAFRHRCPTFIRRGTRKYTFKTSFGKVICPLIRVQAEGGMRRPSVEAWQLPSGSYETAGLRDLSRALMLNVSTRKTLAYLEETTGEKAILSRTDLWERVCEEGQRRSDAIAEQAEETLAANPAGAAERLATVSPEEQACAREETESTVEQKEAFTASNTEFEEGADPSALIGFGGQRVQPWLLPYGSGPRRIDPGTVIVEADEVVTHAQKQTGRKRIYEYTAVLLTTFVAIHLCAASPEQLQRLVAARLLELGLPECSHRLLFVCDGARWIRAWFRGLSFAGKAMLLCWYHLRKRCEQGLSLACRGRQHREEVEGVIVKHLWHGRVR